MPFTVQTSLEYVIADAERKRSRVHNQFICSFVLKDGENKFLLDELHELFAVQAFFSIFAVS